MKHRPFLAIAVLLILGLFAGCGGGDDGGETTAAAPVETTTPTALTKAELVAQGDAICAEVNAAVGSLSASETEASGQAGQEADLYSGMIERLKALGEPSDDASGYAEFIAAGEDLAQAESNASLAAERGEEEALSAAQSEVSSALASFQTAASSFGLEKCAEAPSAPTPSSGSEEATEEPAEAIEEEAAPEEVEVEPETGGAEEGGGATAGGEEGTGGGGEAGGGSGGIGPG